MFYEFHRMSRRQRTPVDVVDISVSLLPLSFVERPISFNDDLRTLVKERPFEAFSVFSLDKANKQ